jgi:hypothetical protein
LAAGCNKPARIETEKTVKAVRNREDGTGLACGNGKPKPRPLPGNREEKEQEWTSRIHVDGGAIFGNPKRGAWWRPG